MTCPSELELARAISAGVAGAAGPAGADPVIEAHLTSCQACREAWDETQRAINLARELPVTLPPHARREEVRTSVLAAAANVARRPARRAWIAPTLTGALAASLIGYLAIQHGSSPPPSGSSGLSGPPEPPGLSAAHHAHGTVHPHLGARYLASSSGPDEIIRLTDGAIDVAVEPLSPGERFRVIVGVAEIEVRGTAFTVIASDEHLLGVTVAHGRVDVRPEGGAPAMLGTGQSWHAALAATLVEPPPPASSPSSPPLRSSSPSSPSPSPSPSPSSPSSLSSLSSSPSSSSPSSSSPSSSSPSSSSPSSSSPSSSSPSRAEATPRPHHAAMVTPPSQPHPVSVAPPHHAAALAPPHPAEQATPGELAPSPPSPPSSLPPSQQPTEDPARTPAELSYDQAWEALRTNNFTRAASGFARVLLLAPDSPLVEDASFWHAVALARGQRSAEALSAFRDFLDSYGRSARAGEASAMLGWLLIDARAYDEAARRFRAAAGDVSAAVRSSAQAGLDALARRTH